jgi:hypothetical protein
MPPFQRLPPIGAGAVLARRVGFPRDVQESLFHVTLVAATVFVADGAVQRLLR